jgi:pyruvate dehydrogenase E2 component (dihydrolipoamide acetyltransferase)
MNSIVPIKMPKWGLSMEEGTIVSWLKAEGADVHEGDELLEIETAKIVNVADAPCSGVLRRIVAQPGDVVPVGSLLGIIADPEVSESEINDCQVAQTRDVASGPPAEAASTLFTSTVDVGDKCLRYARVGPETGVPIILIHGWAADLTSWLFNSDALAQHLPVYAIDLPGHGGSSKAVGAGSLSEFSQSLGAAMDVLKLDQVHLVGHSFGGGIAARLAADRQELVRTLTLIAPTHMPGGIISREFLDGVISASRARAMRTVLEMLLADPASVTKEMVDDLLKYKRIDGVEEVLRLTRDRLLDDEDRIQLEERLKELGENPKGVLIISSQTDRVISLDERALPDGFRIHWIEGAGHLPHLEKSKEVNNLLIERFCS